MSTFCSIIDVIAPGYGCDAAMLEAASKLIASYGYEARIPDELCDAAADPFSSHDDATRLMHVQHAFAAEDNAAIWCIKGGYGTTRLMDMLWEMEPPTRHRWLLGFSDITALHLLLQQRWGWPSLHAPVLWQAVKGKVEKEDIDACFAFLDAQIASAPPPTHEYALQPIAGAEQQSDAEITAPIIGGNLCVLMHSMGTRWQLDVTDKILFIEDIDEPPYRIDRMLTQLLQTGIVNDCKAVLIGDILEEEGAGDTAASQLRAALQRFAKSCPAPVFSLPGIGHGQHNHPLVLGVEARIAGDRLYIHST